MSYRWAVAGVLEQPIVTIGEARLLGQINRIDFDEKLEELPTIEPGAMPFLPGLYLHRGFLRVHAMHEPYPGLVCQTALGQIAGMCFERYCQIYPYVRGVGIGPELMAEFYCAHPDVLRRRAAQVPRLGWSAAGEKCARAAYRLLVSRGAVLAPSEPAVVVSEACETAATPSWP